MRQVNTGKKTGRVVMKLCWVVVSLTGVVLAGCASAPRAGRPSAPVPGLPVPASAIPRLTATAARAVKVNGGGTPAWITAVATTHEKALTSATPGDTVPGSEQTIVYLLTMKGHFTAGNTTDPPGALAPTGAYLSIVIDAQTFQGMDFGLSPNPPPVAPASLGPLTYLNVRLRARPGLSVHPVTVGPSSGERAEPHGSRWSAPPDERPWPVGLGLLGLSWADGVGG
jgi:hypothetical protein